VVPYRESKLTRLIQNYFISGKAVMIANVSPDVCDFEETVQALKFSAVAKEIVVSEAPPPTLASTTERLSTVGTLPKSSTASASSRKSGVKRKADDNGNIDDLRKNLAEVHLEMMTQMEEMQKQLLLAEERAANTEVKSHYLPEVLS